MFNARVAVIVPTFNRAAHLVAAIDSILTQDQPPEEIIVVDDGSTDDTLTVLQGYGDAIQVISQANAGAAAARNTGARAARADWLTFLDSDDVWCAGRMAALRADLAAADPAVVVHVGNVLFRGVGDARDFFSVARIDVPAGEVRHVSRPLTMFLHAFFLIGAAFRRDVFVDLGGFDAGFPTDEDTEMAHRMADRGAFLVRGDVLADVIRQPGDTAALSGLRRRDPFLANDLKQRHFTGIIARATDPRDRALAAAALSDTLLQRAGLLRRAGQPGYLSALLRAAWQHPSPVKGMGKAIANLLGVSHAQESVDRTA